VLQALSFPVDCFRPCPIGDSALVRAYCMPGPLGGRAGCRVEVLLFQDVEIMDEDRLQGLREELRPCAQHPDSDDEAELLRLQASLPCHSAIASTFCACYFRATVLCVDMLYVDVIEGH